MLGLERLIVGRECNGFDRLSPSRKANAYVELIEGGYARGNVKSKDGQDYPEVVLRGVTDKGKRVMRWVRLKARSEPAQPALVSSPGLGRKIALFLFIFAVVLLLALMILSQS